MADDCQFRMIRVDSGHPPSIPTGMTYEEAKNRVVEIFQRMADLSRPFDIDIVWEFEPGFFLNKPSEIIGLHNLVKRDNFYYMLKLMPCSYVCFRGGKANRQTERHYQGVKLNSSNNLRIE